VSIGVDSRLETFVSIRGKRNFRARLPAVRSAVLDQVQKVRAAVARVEQTDFVVHFEEQPAPQLTR
jgi:hypothetical protein